MKRDVKYAVCPSCKNSVPTHHFVYEHSIPRFLDNSKQNKGKFKICKDCSADNSADEYSLYLVYSASENKKFYNSFLKTTYEIQSLVMTPLHDETLRKSLNRLLYVNTIAALETYLSDAFINTVTNEDSLIRLLVETDPEFRNRKFDLSQVYIKRDEIEQDVNKYLAEIIYHNLGKIKPMYKSVLGVDFPENLSYIFRAIKTRHDIAHRCGKTKAGEDVDISKEKVSELVEITREFVEVVNKQLPVENSD